MPGHRVEPGIRGNGRGGRRRRGRAINTVTRRPMTLDLFDEPLHFANVFPHRRLTLEVPLGYSHALRVIL